MVKLLIPGDPLFAVSQEASLPKLHAGKSIALISLGMGAYFIYLYHVGFQEVIRSLAHVNLSIFSIGIALAILGVLFDALAWQRIARKFDFDVSTWDIFLIYLACIFMNNLIPSGSFSGETTRVYFLEKLSAESRIDKSSATVAATRIITSIPFILGTAIGLIYLISSTDVPVWALAICSSIAGVLLLINILFLGVCYADGWLERIVVVAINWTEKLLRIHINRQVCLGIVRQFHQSMIALIEHKRSLFISTFWAVMGWLCMTMVAFVTFLSMGIEVPMRAVFAVYAVMIFLQMLPLLLPGGIGIVDIVMITLFSAISVPTHGAVAATILMRLIQLWMLTVLGGISMIYLVQKTSRMPAKPAMEILAKSF